MAILFIEKYSHFLILLSFCFRQKTLIINDESLMCSLADHAGCIVCFYLKYKALSVHLNQLCLAGNVHADRCGCHMLHID